MSFIIAVNWPFILNAIRGTIRNPTINLGRKRGTNFVDCNQPSTLIAGPPDGGMLMADRDNNRVEGATAAALEGGEKCLELE